MGHFNDQYISDCDLRTTDDDELDRRDGVSSKPSLVNWNSEPAAKAKAHTAAQQLANVTQSPAYVVRINNAYLVQDDQDLACYGGIGAVVATFEPRTDDTPAPGIESEPEGPPVYPDPNGRAQTLQSQQIEATMERNHLCPNCQGPHWGWRCPETHSLLRLDAFTCDDCEHVLPLASFTFQHDPDCYICDTCYRDAMEAAPAPTCSSCGDATTHPILCAACQEWGTPAYDTSELAHLWATSRTLLAAKLARLSRAQLHTQSVAFAAWLDTQTHAGLSAASVLHIWETFVLAGGDPVQLRAA